MINVHWTHRLTLFTIRMVNGFFSEIFEFVDCFALWQIQLSKHIALQIPPWMALTPARVRVQASTHPFAYMQISPIIHCTDTDTDMCTCASFVFTYLFIDSLMLDMSISYRFNRVSCDIVNDRCQTLSYLSGCFTHISMVCANVWVCVCWCSEHFSSLLIAFYAKFLISVCVLVPYFWQQIKKRWNKYRKTMQNTQKIEYVCFWPRSPLNLGEPFQ